MPIDKSRWNAFQKGFRKALGDPSEEDQAAPPPQDSQDQQDQEDQKGRAASLMSRRPRASVTLRKAYSGSSN